MAESKAINSTALVKQSTMTRIPIWPELSGSYVMKYIDKEDQRAVVPPAGEATHEAFG